jgi:hypothetical protein
VVLGGRWGELQLVVRGVWPPWPGRLAGMAPSQLELGLASCSSSVQALTPAYRPRSGSVCRHWFDCGFASLYLACL